MAGEPLQEHTFVSGKARNLAYLERLKVDLAAAREAGDEDAVKQLATQYELFEEHVNAWQEVDPAPPTLSFERRMTLFRGPREIQLLFLGRAHTGGDISVYLPKEGLVFTGDMMLGGPSWLGDGFVDEWDETLENLKALDFEVIVPGHGLPFRDRERINYVQAFYRDLWAQTRTLFDQGVPRGSGTTDRYDAPFGNTRCETGWL